MTIFTIDLATLLLCWTLPGLVSAKGFSKTTLDLLAIFNGDYDNSMQVKNGNSSQVLIQFRVVAVDISALRPATAWYLEWAADGKVLQMEIDIITERPGPTIYVTLNNFTNPSLSKHRPGEFNVSTLSDLKPDDLQGNGCAAEYRQLDKAVFVGYYPDCYYSIRGNFLNYADTVTCNETSTVIPPTARETFSPTPYIFQRKGQRYRYPGIPDTYDSICGKGRYSS